MNSYELGFNIGKVLSIIGGFLIIYFFLKIPTMIKYIFKKLFPNHIKDTMKVYLFWSEFSNGITSIEEFKKRLKKIENIKVYQDEFYSFYLSLDEAKAIGKDVKETTIKEVLQSESYPLFLIKRLERITLYSKKDLKNITRDSSLIWVNQFDMWFHFVLKDNKILYPNDYNQDNIYRFGYMIVHNTQGKLGVYDITKELLSLDTKYNYIKCIGNIALISLDNESYDIYNLSTKEILKTTNSKELSVIYDEFVDAIDFSLVELYDYIGFYKVPINQADLVNMGLWGKKVAVVELPSGFDEIIKDKSGTIRWAYPISADMYDMSVELPVEFEKNDGSFVTLGITFDKILLEDRSAMRKPNKDEKMHNSKNILPNWLKIKNADFNDVDISKNSVDKIVALNNGEFQEFVSLTNQNLIFTYLSTLSSDELDRFYKYTDTQVVLEDGAISAKDQFVKIMDNFSKENIPTINKQRATLEIDLCINHAKYIHHQAVDFKKFVQDKYYPYEESEAKFYQVEGNMFKVIYGKEMKYIPDTFEQILTFFKEHYDATNEEHKNIGIHLAKRFGLLMNSLHIIQKYQDEKVESIEWFLQTFIEDIKQVNGHDILSDDELIFYIMNMFASIIHENDDAYIQALIDIVYELVKYYPFNTEAFLYALQELMKSVALKKMSVKNANNFLKIFEELPKIYNMLSYDKIIELKDTINIILANDKPQDNEIFEHSEVKSKIILLNYLVDMEDLYYEN